MQKTQLLIFLFILSLSLSERLFSPPKGYYPLGKWEYVPPPFSEVGLNLMDDTTTLRVHHTNATKEIEYTVDMDMTPGVVNIDAEEDVLSVQCNSDFEVRMKVSSFENVLKWVRGSKLFVGRGWECTQETPKSFTVIHSRVTGDDEVTFETVPTELRDLIKNGNVRVKYISPQEEPKQDSPLASPIYSFERSWCINCEKYNYTVFNLQNSYLKIIAPSAEFFTTVEIEFNVTSHYYPPFIKVRAVKVKINGRTIINFGFELEFHGALKTIREIYRLPIYPISLGGGIFTITPTIALDLSIDSTIQAYFLYLKKFTVHWEAGTSYSETTGFRLPYGEITRIDDESLDQSNRFEVEGHIEFALIPKLIFTIGALADTVTLPVEFRVKPYLTLEFQTDSRCMFPPIYYKSFWGIDWSFQVHKILVDLWLTSFELELGGLLPYPKELTYYELLKKRPLKCKYCHGCLTNTIYEISTMLFKMYVRGYQLPSSNERYKVMLKNEQSVIETSLEDYELLLPGDYQLSFSIGAVPVFNQTISIQENENKELNIDLGDNVVIVEMKITLEGISPNVNLSVEVYNQSELLAADYRLLPSGTTTSTFFVPKGVMKVNYFDQDTKNLYGPFLYDVQSDMSIEKDIQPATLNFEIQAEVTRDFSYGYWLLYQGEYLLRNQSFKESSTMKVIPGQYNASFQIGDYTYQPFSQVDVVDDYTVRFNLNGKFALLIVQFDAPAINQYSSVFIYSVQQDKDVFIDYNFMEVKTTNAYMNFLVPLGNLTIQLKFEGYTEPAPTEVYIQSNYFVKLNHSVKPICNNKIAGENGTCNDHGTCIAPEQCLCLPEYQGRYCEEYVQQPIGAGSVHSAIVARGLVYTFGYNYYGQLGDGTFTDSNIPKIVSLPGTVTYVSGGGFTWSYLGYFYGFTLAVLSNGDCASWGYNYYGQLGDGTTTTRNSPVYVKRNTMGNRKIILASAGEDFSLVVTHDGQAYGFGRNHYGQLGDGTTTNRAQPVPVKTSALGGRKISRVSAGGWHTLLLTTDGKVYAWGYNGYGQIGDGSTTNRYQPVFVSLLANKVVVAVSAGECHSVALTTEGKVYTWGCNDYGQLGIGSTGYKTIPQLVNIENEYIISISAGSDHTIALSINGVAYAWGHNEYGNLGNGTTTNSLIPIEMKLTKRIKRIDAGGWHTIVVTENDEAFSVGYNYYGQLGTGSTNSVSYLTPIYGCMTHRCHNRGVCIFNTCSCYAGYTGSRCELSICNSRNSSDPLVCSGRGKCIASGICICEDGWSGSDCDIPACYGINATHSDVCGGNGQCVDVNTCICNPGYVGSQCEYKSCHGILSTDPNVCNGHGDCLDGGICSCHEDWTGTTCSTPVCEVDCSEKGSCVAPNVCSCYSGYTGNICQIPICYGKNASDIDNVCSGVGTCVAANNCSCQMGYEGLECEIKRCFGKKSNDDTVCSGNGNCIAGDTCSCSQDWGGYECQYPKCFGKLSTDETVCNSHGSCIEPNICSCTSGYTGLECQYPICYGKYSNDPTVCNSNGNCIAPSTCSCNANYTGTQCENPVCYGKSATDSQACSSFGSCIEPNKCLCNPGYIGPECEYAECFGKPSHASDVCSGRGICNEPNNCTCTDQMNWGGYECQYPKCFGKLSTDETVCNSHGTCIEPNTCSCTPGYDGQECEFQTCFGKFPNDPDVCSGRGSCTYPNSCSCINGWGGNECQYPICFGKLSNGETVCNSHGTCVAPDTCICNTTNYVGSECQYPICYGLNSTNPEVCSSNGICISPDTCTCLTGYSGSNCEWKTKKCFGKNETDESVCSSHGICKEVDECECFDGYTGQQCEIVNCFGKLSNDSTVCHARGQCTYPDNCTCNPGYTGNECQTPICFSKPATDIHVCSGHGSCVDANLCDCEEGYNGSNCEYATCFGKNHLYTCSSHGNCSAPNTCDCEVGYTGNECQFPLCFGKNTTDPEVCSGRGKCLEPDRCVCEDSSFGDKCQFEDEMADSSTASRSGMFSVVAALLLVLIELWFQ